MTMPMLCNLSLKGFRSLSSAVLEFDNPTFLVGQNGAGKSNIVDAFSFLSQAMTSPLAAVFDSRGGIATVGTRSAPSGSDMGLRVELENLDEGTRRATYAFALRRDLESYGFEVVREQCAVMRRDGSYSYFDRSRDKFLSNVDSLQPAFGANALALPLVGGDTRFLSLFRFLTMMRVYRIEPAALREMQDPSMGVQLRSDGRNAASVWREIKARSSDNSPMFRELLKKIVPGAIDIRPKMHGFNKWSLELIQEGTDTEPLAFEAHEMSDGTLRALGILAAVFQPLPPSVLVIEEPEATIHPGALGAILDLLRHAGRFMQVVVTTHSPDILDASWIEESHLRIVNWNEGATRIAPVSEASRIALGEHLMGAGELMRSNALTATDFSASDPPEIALFEEGLV